MTPHLIAEAMARRSLNAKTSFGEDLSDLSWLSKAVGLVISNDLLVDPKFPRQDLANVAAQLRWIHIIGAGIEPLLPLDWLPAHITLTNNSGVHATKIRELALMMLLMVHARVPTIVGNQRKSNWQQIFTPGIAGRVVLIIGVGDMGGAVASAARDLKLKVLGVRRSGAPHPSVDEMYRPDQLDAVLPQADIVAMAAPLTSDTAAMIDSRRFQLMKDGAGFINIGRAGSVDQAAFLAALNNGKISSAVIDVYDREPLPADSPLWTANNVIMMPHVTADDEDQYLPKTFDLVLENYVRLQNGMNLLNVVDRERGY